MDAHENLEAALTEFLRETKRNYELEPPDTKAFPLEAVGGNLVDALLSSIDEVFPADEFACAKILASLAEDPDLQQASAALGAVVRRLQVRR